MKILAAFVLLAIAHAAPAATPCEIRGDAVHWAYDACFGRFETDDELHPGVVACAERGMALIRSKGTCSAKRIFKGRMCTRLQQTEDRRRSFKACMADPSVVGSTVKNGGIQGTEPST